MYIEKAILILATRAKDTRPDFDPEMRNALKMAVKALELLAHGKGHRLDDLSLKLLLDTERRDNEREREQ